MSEITPSDKLKYLLEIDGRILESIQFADRKSSIYLTISGAMLAFLIKAYPLQDNFPKSICSVPEVLTLLAYLSTALAIIFLSCVIWPKGFKTDKQEGYFDPLRITKFGHPHVYRQSYQKADGNQLTDDACELVFDRSKTNSRKYKWLKPGLVLAYCSWVFTAVVFITLPMKDKIFF